MVTYNKYDVVFQEIPNETSLAFTIEGCPNNCVGCHSPHLREQNGTELTQTELLKVLSKYGNNITCVLFLGGDAFHDEMYELFKVCSYFGYRVAFYSGNDVLNEKLFDYLTYYKVGHYNYKLGGLDNPNTNQRIYKYNNFILEDITGGFWNV
jgi:anaerobic ribonucleoside-triphosphate reductase activating protein